jgi:phosphocarrier protein
MADTQTHEVTATICNELGMHARAATKFVQLAHSYKCDVFVEKDGHEINGKSIMGVLMLVAAKGSVIRIRTVGEDSKTAAEALQKLVRDRFGEDK